jgi:cytoskeletal protein CcmA (bactofilin family)
MLQRDTFFGRTPDKKPDVPSTAAAAVASTAPGSRSPGAVNTPSVDDSRRPVTKPVAGKADTQGSQLIVGPNIKLKGVEIHDCDTLVVEGRVEATMVSRAIQISETGAFNGKVDVEVAEIRGHFQGEMTARKRLVVHASGRVSGKIRYGKMLVQEGGEITGDVGTISEAASVTAFASAKT